MTFEEEIKSIPNKETVNFIATATTPWHAHGIVACIYYLKSHGIIPTGYIFLTPHVTTGYALDKSDFPDLPDMSIRRIAPPSLSLFSNIQKMYNALEYTFLRARKRKDKRILYYAEPWTVDSAQSSVIIRQMRGVYIQHLVYDEGVSTYFPIKLKGSNVADRLKNIFTEYVTFGVSYRFLVKKGVVTSAKLFAKTGQIVEPNSYIVPFYKQAIKEFCTNEVRNYTFPPKTVVVCTTAWERKEIIDQEDIRKINWAVNILTRRGFNVMFKPHPRDCCFSQLYPEAQLVPHYSGSLESIFSSVSQLPALVLSISSTILVTSKLFFNLKSIDLSALLDVRKIGRYIDETTAFRNAFGNFVDTPSTAAEFFSSLDYYNS